MARARTHVCTQRKGGPGWKAGDKTKKPYTACVVFTVSALASQNARTKSYATKLAHFLSKPDITVCPSCPSERRLKEDGPSQDTYLPRDNGFCLALAVNRAGVDSESS